VFKIIALLAVFIVGMFCIADVYGQEMKRATYQENAQVIFDQSMNNEITASIVLESTSNLEMRISDELEQKILDNPLVQSIVFTNHGECVLGVFDSSCIMINFALEDLKIKLAEQIEKEKVAGVGIRAIQEGTREFGDLLINDINNELNINTVYNSVFIHTGGEASRQLNTSGNIAGQGSVSVVYTMPKQSTDFIFADLTGKLLPKQIRDNGGFFSTAKELSKSSNSEMSFTMIPRENSVFYSVKVSLVYPDYTPDFQRFEIIDPLEYLNVNELKRSGYFSGGFYPLNSLIQVMIITNQQITIESISTNQVKQLLTVEDVSTNGYFVESNSGNNIDLRYLFGDKQSVAQNELTIKLVGMNDNTPTEIQSNENLGGGCLIATAAFGSEMVPQVQFLRELRDNTVLQTQSGTSFMTGFNQFYYSFSPMVADYERENPMFKETVKLAITPLLTSLTLLNYVDIDSESEMLVYGIGIIMLNIGMYFVVPAIVITKLKNILKLKN